MQETPLFLLQECSNTGTGCLESWVFLLGEDIKNWKCYEQLFLVNLTLTKGDRLDDLQGHFSISAIVLWIWVLMLAMTMSVLGLQLKSRKQRAAGLTEARRWKKTNLYISCRSFLELILMCLDSISWLFCFSKLPKNCQSRNHFIF